MGRVRRQAPLATFAPATIGVPARRTHGVFARRPQRGRHRRQSRHAKAGTDRTPPPCRHLRAAPTHGCPGDDPIPTRRPPGAPARLAAGRRSEFALCNAWRPRAACEQACVQQRANRTGAPCARLAGGQVLAIATGSRPRACGSPRGPKGVDVLGYPGPEHAARRNSTPLARCRSASFPTRGAQRACCVAGAVAQVLSRARVAACNSPGSLAQFSPFPTRKARCDLFSRWLDDAESCPHARSSQAIIRTTTGLFAVLSPRARLAAAG